MSDQQPPSGPTGSDQPQQVPPPAAPADETSPTEVLPAAQPENPPAPPVWPAHAPPPAAPPAGPQATGATPSAPGYPAVPAPGYAGQGYPPPPGYPAPAPGYASPAYSYPAASTTSTNAIVGLVLAIVSWIVCPIIPAVVALILAGKSDREIAASQGRVNGTGLNTATRIVSWINIGVYGAVIVGFGLFFLVFAVLSAAGSV